MHKILLSLLCVIMLLISILFGYSIKYYASKKILNDIVANKNSLIKLYLSYDQNNIEDKSFYYKNIASKLLDIEAIEIVLYDFQANIIATKSNYIIKLDDSGYIDNLVLSMLPNYNMSRSEMFIKSLQKISTIKLVTNASIKKSPNDHEEKKAVIHSFSYITLPNNDILPIEIYTDGTSYWNFLNLVHISVSVLAFIFSMVSIYIYLSVSIRSQSIIDKQIEANLELKNAREKAEELHKQKSQFFANMSHELRTPLNSIIGFSEMIKNEALGPVGIPNYKEYANDIFVSGSHLLDMINEILDFSKAEADKLQVDKIEVDVVKAIKQSSRIIQPKAETAKVKIIENIPEEHFIIIADPKRLKQVMLNILSNAVKFTPENGTITVKITLDDSKSNCIIDVSDTGIGINAKDISKVMSPFGQVDSSLSKKHEGTGLGLPLTKKLVELMGGKFHIESEPSLGTRIILTFKLSTSDTKSEEGPIEGD